MNLYPIECSLINTMFESEVWFKEKPFKMEPSVFMYPYNRKLIQRINHAIDNDESTSLLTFIIQDEAEGTRHEQDFLEIIIKTPLIPSVAKKYYDFMRLQYVKRLAK